jgi:hypothetical protein
VKPDHLSTFAFACPSHRWAVSHAAGVEPLTAPPTTIDTFDPGLLADRRLLYFSLHGIPDQPYWYGQDLVTAMSVDAFQGLDLSDTVVFVANCHLGETPFLPAILDCNPRCLVGGTGVNFTRAHTLVGAHLLGYLFRLALELGLEPQHAFAIARYSLRKRNDHTAAQAGTLTQHKDRHKRRRLEENMAANTDALHFRAYT